MRHPIYWLFVVILVTAATSALAANADKKLEKVREMFQSPYSEEDYYRTDRLLATATGSQLPVHKAPAVASIVTAEDIEKMGAVSLAEILETVPGIHVGPSAESGYRTNYHIRGIYTGLNQSGPYWAGVTDTLSTGNELDDTSYLADLRCDKVGIAPDWELSGGVYYLNQKSDSRLVLFPPGAVVLVGSDGNLFTGANPVTFPDGVIGAPERTEQTVAGDVSAIFTGIRAHRLRLGAGAKHVELEARSYANFGPGVIDGTQPVVDGALTDVTGTPYAYIPDKNRQLWFVFGQDEWSLARRWTLTAGLRYDHYSDFGGTFNPRLALVWETRYDLTTKLLYGRAFRPPTFQELYVQNNPATIGNPDLDPETIQSLELALDYQPVSRLRTIVNLFVYQADDLIEFVANPAGGKTAQNARDQEGYGFEFEMDWQITDAIQLRANCAFQDSEDQNTDATVANTPQWQFYINPHWNFRPDWSLDAQWKWIDDRRRAEGDTRDDVPDYSLVGLTLRRKNILKHWDLAVAGRNLMDEDVREPTRSAIPGDYPMPGRSVFAEVRLRY